MAAQSLLLPAGALSWAALAAHCALSRPERMRWLHAATLSLLLGFRWQAWRGTPRMWSFTGSCYFFHWALLMLLFTRLRDDPDWQAICWNYLGWTIWAVPVWRNALVLRDPEQLSALYVHLAPALVLYVERWKLKRCQQSPKARHAAASCGLVALHSALCLLLHFAVADAGQPLRVNFYEHFMTRFSPQLLKHAVRSKARLIWSFTLYTIGMQLYGAASAAAAVPLHASRQRHLGALILNFAIACYNGAQGTAHITSA
eukprot:TRINITY_DN11699_c0_g2_i1.p2 TRINITY_DN11699_c0_g2~~TRINITY_DN11699_c0_g2_i1.p2  ORF type:complete len:290 (+),score=104.58 TRINITY_DN11699_c0_g2_i1:98-871(+)